MYCTALHIYCTVLYSIWAKLIAFYVTPISGSHEILRLFNIPNIEKMAISKIQNDFLRWMQLSSQRKLHSSRWDNFNSSYVTPTSIFNVILTFKKIPNIDKMAICMDKIGLI